MGDSRETWAGRDQRQPTAAGLARSPWTKQFATVVDPGDIEGCVHWKASRSGWRLASPLTAARCKTSVSGSLSLDATLPGSQRSAKCEHGRIRFRERTHDAKGRWWRFNNAKTMTAETRQRAPPRPFGDAGARLYWCAAGSRSATKTLRIPAALKALRIGAKRDGLGPVPTLLGD